MRNRIYIAFLLTLHTGFLCAQKVLYSPFIGNQSATRFEIIGKAGDYYWIQKSKKKFSTKASAAQWNDNKDFNFEIYDTRMNLVKTIPSSVSEIITKEYFVPGNEYLDELIFKPADQKIMVLLTRYTPDGNIIHNKDTLADLPGNMNCNDILLVRSQDKNKILLLGFEPVPESSPRLNAFLFDKNWGLIYHTIYTNNNISQPFIQYDIIDFPLEHFNNNAVKLANNGEWLMAVPSRMNHNFLLVHFNRTGEAFVSKEIKLPSATIVEEVGLFLDNEKEKAFTGILSRIRYPAIKNVTVAQYSLTDKRFDFDTSYRFNTLAIKKTNNENIFEEYFMAVPGKGFMLLKEYGRSYSFNHPEEKNNTENEGSNEIDIIEKQEAGPINKDEYTRYNNLAGTRSKFDRGDLSLYYFPATANDSCWSGIINKEQITELNSSYLSYVFLPKDDKLFFLYNSFFRNRDEYSSTTVLDNKGNSLNEGVMYWKINNTLVFQKARQISENELAIPYVKNLRNGFVIIRL